MSRVLTLFSTGLLSKWGFSDGDLPDEIWDILDERGHHDAEEHWHDVLTQLVETRLVPTLDQTIELVTLETSHNPVRAYSVDGRVIDHTADNDDIVLTPDSVDVPLSEVVDLLLAAAT